MVIFILFILGLCAGSFVNALVWRLHQQQTKKNKPNPKLSIINGRSMCVNCRHELAWNDLLPLISWLILKGECRYCKKPISRQYPLLELVMAVVFVASYAFWPDSLSLNGQRLLLAAWLLASVGLLALATYDLKWMMLPNRIIYPTLLIAVMGRAGYIIFYEHHRLHATIMWAGSVLVASGIFYLLFTVSNGKWIGFGDVRLGLVTGTLLAKPQYSLLMIFIASVLGTLVALPDLLRHKKTLASRLPFGPFLIIATFIVVVFGSSVLNDYKAFMGLN